MDIHAVATLLTTQKTEILNVKYMQLLSDFKNARKLYLKLRTYVGSMNPSLRKICKIKCLFNGMSLLSDSCVYHNLLHQFNILQ